MTAKSKPNEALHVCDPVAIARSGNLSASFWNSDGREVFAFGHVGNSAGAMSVLFSPADVFDLTELLITVVEHFEHDTSLERQLRDDLECLSHCLREVVPRPTSVDNNRSLEESLSEAAQDFERNPTKHHRYRSLLLLSLWSENTVAVDDCALHALNVLPEDAYFGVCPICGSEDGFFNIDRGQWFICNRHRLRWFCGSNLFSSWRPESRDEQMTNWIRYGSYREVVPFYPRTNESKTD